MSWPSVPACPDSVLMKPILSGAWALDMAATHVAASASANVHERVTDMVLLLVAADCLALLRICSADVCRAVRVSCQWAINSAVNLAANSSSQPGAGHKPSILVND